MEGRFFGLTFHVSLACEGLTEGRLLEFTFHCLRLRNVNRKGLLNLLYHVSRACGSGSYFSLY